MKHTFSNLLNLPEINESERNIGLDIVRVVAITLVLISHGRILIPEFPGWSLLKNGGYFGVELFFVLSGFLIGSILMKLFNEIQHDNSKSQMLLNFGIRRWFRTIPNYFLFLILNLTLFQWLFAPKPMVNIKYFFFLQNLFWPSPSAMPEAWSLSVEEWFYISLPLTILFFYYLQTRRFIKISSKNAVFSALILYICIFTVGRFIAAFSENSLWDAAIRKVVFYRLDACAYGVLISYLNFYHCVWLEKNTKQLLIIGCAFTLLSVIIYSYSILTTRETYLNKSILFTITNMGLALLLPWFKTLRVENRRIAYLLSHLSIASYSMYLIHVSFIIPLLLIIQARSFWIISPILYLPLTIFMSTIVYKYYEKPMTMLRERFSKRETHFVQQNNL